MLTEMLEIVLTSKRLGPPKIRGPRLKPFKPNGKSAPGYNLLTEGMDWNLNGKPTKKFVHEVSGFSLSSTKLHYKKVSISLIFRAAWVSGTAVQ